jgi:hypothetical protein
LIVNSTPVETHLVRGHPILVKREDLCSPFPGPQFSKIRGLVPHLKSRPEQVIGILDTFHSKAGWAVAHVCKELGKQAVVFYPKYKYEWHLETSGEPQDGSPDDLRIQQAMAKTLGAELVPLQATAGYILEIRAKKLLQEMYPGAYMLPVGLKMPESVDENVLEAERTCKTFPLEFKIGTLVISVSSGTVASGVIRGLDQMWYKPRVTIAHLGYSRPIEGKKGLRANMAHKANMSMDHVIYHDEGYAYRDVAVASMYDITIPFPANPYYDAKAFRYVERNIVDLPKPVLFWNVGA